MSRFPYPVVLRGDRRWVRIFGDNLSSVRIPVSVIPGALWKPWQARPNGLRSFTAARILHELSMRNTRRSPVLLDLWRRTGRVAIAHWIGTDVGTLKDHLAGGGVFPEYLRHYDVHLADSPELQTELRELGVETEVARLLPRAIEGEVLPLPEKPTVLSYWQDTRPGFYGSDVVKKLAEQNPSVRFWIVGATGKDFGPRPANMQFLGPLDSLEDVYRQTTCLLRMPERDSLGAMVLEALRRGRYVIYSKPFPQAHHATTYTEAEDALRDILNRSAPNQNGADYVSKHFNWRSEAMRLRGLYRRLLAEKRTY